MTYPGDVVEREFPHGVPLSAGFILFRLASGFVEYTPEGAEAPELKPSPIAEACERLEKLREKYPSLEVRTPGGEGKRPAIQEISKKHLTRYAGAIGHVSVVKALNALLDEVPSINQEVPVTMTRLDRPYVLSGNNLHGRFVTLVPTQKDRRALGEETVNLLGALRKVTGLYDAVWNPGVLDMTAAFVPAREGPKAVDEVTQTLEEFLPMPVTLLRAGFKQNW